MTIHSEGKNFMIVTLFPGSPKELWQKCGIGAYTTGMRIRFVKTL